MKEKLKIVLTGGGTAGHVIPHLALLPLMKKLQWDINYIGSKGVEKTLAQNNKIKFTTIRAGKLRRYLSFQNMLDAFNVIIGTIQSFYALFLLKPDVVFSKGGFVSVPVAVAAWLLRIPVVTHESDVTPGLANKIIMKFAHTVLYSFPQTIKFIPQKNTKYTGTPIREELFHGSKIEAFKLCAFRNDDERPVVLIMGGSQGAATINRLITENIHSLCKLYRIIHITGKNKQTDLSLPGSYWQTEYVEKELKNILASCDVVISRSGANSIFEFLALAKPMILIPLRKGSRGDQIINAHSFAERGWAHVLHEKTLTIESLTHTLDHTLKDSSYIPRLEKIKSEQKNSCENIIKILSDAVQKL